ncbi:hypothetical protein AB0I60_15090 [Actinosynnema sp. NPDC050436]|uniref:hypothetical protein n=1 Tax=Actinosynnema sp. NPDC050436 TaxID=3155659 RepID=UPI0033E33EC8
MIVSSVRTDHPSWLSAGDTTYRAVRSGRSSWVLTCTPTRTDECWAEAHPVVGEGDAPVLDVIDLDRLSVIRSLADALSVSVGDLIGEPTLLDWIPEGGMASVSALRATLMDYRQPSPLAATPNGDAGPIDLDGLRSEVEAVINAYEASKYGFVANRVPLLLADAVQAVQTHGPQAQRLLALSYQAAMSLLTKLGEADLAWIAAERGLAAAQQTGDPVILHPGLTVPLSCTRPALNRPLRTSHATHRSSSRSAPPGLPRANRTMLSIYGSLFLAGATAAARANDHTCTQDFLREANDTAQRLGANANWC